MGPNCWVIQSREESGMALLDLGYFNHFLQVGSFQQGQFLKESGRACLETCHCSCISFQIWSPDLRSHWAYLRHRHMLRMKTSDLSLWWHETHFGQAELFRCLYPCIGLPSCQESWLAPSMMECICVGERRRRDNWGSWECIVPCEAWAPAPPGSNSCLSCPAPGPACSPSSTWIVIKDTNPNHWGVLTTCPPKASWEVTKVPV